MNFIRPNNNQTLPQQLPLAAVLILSVPAMIIILLTIFGNLLVLFFKARVGRTNTTLLVWNLGLTDFLVGVFVLPMGAFYLLNRRWAFGHWICRIWVGADVTFCTCSVVTICIISVDRYLAVTRPLRYKSVVTKLKVVTVIILIWAFSFGILLATVRWDSHPKTRKNKTCFVGDEIRYLAHSVVFAFFLPASVTLTLYWRIYSLARDRQRALDRGFLMILGHNMNFLTNTLSQATALRVHIGRHNGMVEHQRRVLRTHERIAKTLGVVSCSFLFCWLPFFTLYLFNYQCENCIPSLVIEIASWLGYCNSMLNPIIYSFTVKEFKRSAFCVILPVWQCVHRWLPKIVSKPPDSKTTKRIVRKRQQITTTPQQQRSKTTLPGQTTFFTERKRKMSKETSRTGAVASLMLNTNCSIAQNAVTSAMMKKQGKRNESSEGEEIREEGNATCRRTARMANGFEKETNSKSSMVVFGDNANLAQKLKQRRRSSLDELDVRRYTDEGEFFNRSGLVTTTLLLATSESICGGGEQSSEQYGRSEVEANSLPLSASFSSLGSDLTSSQSKTVRMPCKISLKKRKRHSLNDIPSADTKQKKKKREQFTSAGHRRALFSAFKKARGDVQKINDEDGTSTTSPTGGMWKRARAMALRRQLKMSGSSSQSSLSSRIKKFKQLSARKEIGEESEKSEKRENDMIGAKRESMKLKTDIQIVCITDVTSL